MRGPIIATVFYAIALPLPGAVAALVSEKGDSEGYWNDHSVVIAEVAEIRENDAGNDIVGLRPIGTVAGRFDCGATALLTVPVPGPTVSSINEPPKRGALVLAVLQEELPDETDQPGYSLAAPIMYYMPRPYAALHTLDGLSDQRIDATRCAVVKVRKDVNERKLDRRILDREGPNAFWRRHCLIDAAVTEVAGGENPRSSPKLSIVPRRSAAGFLGADDKREMTVDVPAGLFARDAKLPGKGARILVLIARTGDHYSISTQKAKVMPGDHSPLWVITNPSDPSALRPVPLLGSLDFWATHSLLYAKIKSVADVNPPAASREIILEPRLTLAGRFDPALRPDITAVANSRLFASESPPGNGTMVLVLIIQSEKGYVVSDPAEFMPGANHRPICPVWDLSDNRVSDTLRAIRELRARESASREVKP